MPIDLEEQLRDALRPVDPDAGFAERVARVVQNERRRQRSATRAFVWLATATAAGLLIAVLVGHEHELTRERQGREARRQLVAALEIADQKLDLALRAVNERSPASRGASEP
jgi:type VI protein secretion system component VasF